MLLTSAEDVKLGEGFGLFTGGGGCLWMSEGSSTTNGKTFPSWSCCCTFSNRGGRGGSLLCSLACAPRPRPREDCETF